MAKNVVAQLVIIMHDDGSVAVNGPIENKLLAYGLLEIAKDTVTKHVDKLVAGGGQIIAPPPGFSAGILKGS